MRFAPSTSPEAGEVYSRALADAPARSYEGAYEGQIVRREAAKPARKPEEQMILHDVRVHPSKDNLKREDQLAWKFAMLAADKVPVEKDVAEMIVNRIIDNAAVAVASVNRHAPMSARDMALGHPRPRGAAGATVFGVASSKAFSPEYAAWANGTAVRELDMHDTFLAADYSHPGDNIPPILAVAQTMGKSGRDLVRGIATGYEIHIDLVRAISLHKHRIDHIMHLCPAQAAGIGTLLSLKPEVIYQAVQQAVHVSVTTRQSRKGEISSWKAYAPAHAGKLAVEAVDRVMRGEGAPSPIYEGEDSVIAWVLDGPQAHYQVPLPAPGEPKRAILDSFTKEHSAEYQSQALIDLAFRMREKIADLEAVEKIVIHTSHHTHAVIGTGANDPQKMDPKAQPRDAGSLDHVHLRRRAAGWALAPRRQLRAEARRAGGHGSAVAQDRDARRSRMGAPLSVHRPERARVRRPGRGAHCATAPTLVDEMAVANAHPLGAKPFTREDYIRKFQHHDRRHHHARARRTASWRWRRTCRG